MIKERKDISSQHDKERIARLALGAASVLAGTSIYASRAANVKADQTDTSALANETTMAENQEGGIRNASYSTGQQTLSAEQLSNQAIGQGVQWRGVQLNQVTGENNNGQVGQSSQRSQSNQSIVTPTSAPANGQQIDSANYSLNNMAVMSTDGVDESEHGHIALTGQLELPDTSKINAGDYIDIKLGAPTTDGKFVDYDSQLLPNQDVIVTNQNGIKVKVGEIQQIDANTNTGYYRIVFNDMIRTFQAPKINLQLIWQSMVQSGIMLRLYTQKAGQGSSTLLFNDLKIGNDVTTAWLQVPVIYVPSSGQSEQSYDLAQNYYTIQHLWTTDANGQQTLKVYGLNETVQVQFADKLSNKFTVTVQGLGDNPYFETEYYSGDQIAQQIEEAIKQQKRTITIGTKVKDHPDLGLGVLSSDDGVQAPTVTVTRTAGTTTDGYQTMTYQITINSDQPVAIGTTPITFAAIKNKDGVLPNPASTIKTYAQDQQSIASSTNSFNRSGYTVSRTYHGPSLANQEMQQYMSTHAAAYVTVHDDSDSSNNTGHLGNVPFYNAADSQYDLGVINFGVGVAQQTLLNDNGLTNYANGTGTQSGTQDVTDTKKVTETIHYQYADGSQAAADHTETVTFTRHGIKNLADNTTKWQDWKASSDGWQKVDSPVIADYTASPASVPAKSVTVDTKDAEVTVVYTKDQAQVTVNYIDQDDNNRVLSSKQLKGDVGSDTNYNTKDEISELAKQHYILASDQTNGNDLTITDGKTYNVYFRHDSTPVKGTQEVTQTIHYRYENGEPAAEDHVSEITFTRTGVHDEVTGKDSWDPWVPAKGSFAAVISPTIDGYTADPAQVDAQTIVADSSNQELTVVYTKKAADRPVTPSDSNDKQVPTNNAQSTSTTAPEGYHWETLRVLVPNGQSAANVAPASATMVKATQPSPSQEQLPQTGNRQQHIGFVMTLLASILGIFGLSWWPFAKRRQK